MAVFQGLLSRVILIGAHFELTLFWNRSFLLVPSGSIKDLEKRPNFGSLLFFKIKFKIKYSSANIIVQFISDMYFSADDSRLRELHDQIPATEFYLTSGGKRLNSLNDVNSNDLVQVHFKLLGGKGGFGSLLRAIGSQIRTTDKGSCRFDPDNRFSNFHSISINCTIFSYKFLETWMVSVCERLMTPKS